MNETTNKENVKGVVVWFDAKRGYGFIRINGSSQDVFVHYSNIVTNDYFRQLENGQRVVFSLRQTIRGWAAFNVELADHLVKS